MLFEVYGLMTCENEFNCSDRGQCYMGKCICQVQFAGENCTQNNVGYIAAFSSIFSALCFISIIQLILCIHSEYKQLKQPNVYSAFRVTTQKLLHGVVIVASTTRILYFSLQGVVPGEWLIPMESAYHPLLITGLSLVVCYWSEAFFLETVNIDASRRARFLSKSIVAFAVFNVLLYIMLIAQFIATGVGLYNPRSQDIWLNGGAFQASFGVVLFVVYVVFLAIGVEIFFKLRGAFTLTSDPSTSTSEVVNKHEIFKSRLALVFQALLTLLTILCVIFDAAGSLWKYKVTSRTRSTHEIIYRIAEAGAVLWFPCVLWNTAAPEKLWFLNPRCLLHLTGDAGERLLQGPPHPSSGPKRSYNTFSEVAVSDKIKNDSGECWICYDPERNDAGDFIRPCLCKGGMSQVHHNCLRTWLVQHPHVDEACCKVCKHRYAVEREHVGIRSILLRSTRASLMVPAVVVAVSAPCATLIIFLLCDGLETYVEVLLIGGTIVLELTAFKIMGINFSKLYQATRVSALRILNYTSPASKQEESESKSQEHVSDRSKGIEHGGYDVINESERDNSLQNHSSEVHDSLVLKYASQ